MMSQLLLLSIVDAATFAVLSITALMLWRSGSELGGKIAKMLVYLAAEILIATSSLVVFNRPIVFVAMRTVGRIVEIAGVVAFMLWLMNGRSKSE